jgi:hypothetical protein
MELFLFTIRCRQEMRKEVLYMLQGHLKVDP